MTELELNFSCGLNTSFEIHMLEMKLNAQIHMLVVFSGKPLKVVNVG